MPPRDIEASEVNSRSEKHHPLAAMIAQDNDNFSQGWPKDRTILKRRAVRVKAKPKPRERKYQLETFANSEAVHDGDEGSSVY